MLSISLETAKQLRDLSNEINRIRNCLNQAQLELNNRYQVLESQLGPHTKQIKSYLSKGEILYQKAEQDSIELSQRVLKLAKQIEDYINVTDNSRPIGNTSEKKTIDKQQEQFKFKGLSKSEQSYHTTYLNGEVCQIYDHPEKIAAWGAYDQGNNSYGIRGTCGLCSCATIMNIAGFGYCEEDIVAYAKKHHNCSSSGGTSPDDWNKIIQNMSGINSQSGRIQNLNDLVPEIENGKGIIIGIAPALINEEWYGLYDPNGEKHAVVLASVIRDQNTNEITKYVIIDSNGNTPETACQFIDAQMLQDAFVAGGCFVNITKDILH